MEIQKVAHLVEWKEIARAAALEMTTVAMTVCKMEYRSVVSMVLLLVAAKAFSLVYCVAPK